MKSAALAFGLYLILGTAYGADNATNQLAESALGEAAQRALFPSTSFVLPVATGTPSAAVLDNAAGRLILADISAYPFLGTLPARGISVFYAALKPCGLLSVHSHPRGNEMYTVLSGQMIGAVAQEVGAPENITFKVNVGQNMLVPQGLWHYNYNPYCSPLVFTISYDSADPGTVALSPALAGLTQGNPSAAMTGNFTTSAPSLGPLALDQTCLKTCGLPSTGAPGNGLSGLSQDLQVFLGVASAASPPGGPTTG